MRGAHRREAHTGGHRLRLRGRHRVRRAPVTLAEVITADLVAYLRWVAEFSGVLDTGTRRALP